MYLMTQSLESHKPEKINGPSKVMVMLLTASMYSKTILPTQNTGVPNLTILPTGSQWHSYLLLKSTAL